MQLLAVVATTLHCSTLWHTRFQLAAASLSFLHLLVCVLLIPTGSFELQLQHRCQAAGAAAVAAARYWVSLFAMRQ
jgi:hypothetical protein